MSFGTSFLDIAKKTIAYKKNGRLDIEPQEKTKKMTLICYNKTGGRLCIIHTMDTRLMVKIALVTAI